MEKHIFYGGTWSQQNCIKCGQQHYTDYNWTVHPGWEKECTIPDELYDTERHGVFAYLNSQYKRRGYHIGGFCKRKNGYLVHYHHPDGMPYSEVVNDPLFQGELQCVRFKEM